MTVAIYAGSFDPITIGHLSIVGEAARIFGHVVVLIADNPQKQYLLTNQERLDTVTQSVKNIINVSVAYTNGLVIDYAKSVGATALVRGIRNDTDCPYEIMLAQANKALMPSLTTVVIPANAALVDVSSSNVKEAVRNGQRVDGLCPPNVIQLLKTKV